MDAILLTIGRKVRIARAEADLSQDALARKAGLRQNVISTIETAQRNVSVPELAAIANALQRPLYWFFTESEEEFARVREATGEPARPVGLPPEALDELMAAILDVKRKYSAR